MVTSSSSYAATSSNVIDQPRILEWQSNDDYHHLGQSLSSPGDEQDQCYTWSQVQQPWTEHRSASSSKVSSKPEASTRHQCPKKQCGSNFARLSDLSRHLRTVHGPKQQCLEPGCFYHTARSDNMREHCRRKHSNTSTPDQIYAEHNGDVSEPASTTILYDDLDLNYDFVLFHEDIPMDNWPNGDVLFQPL